MACGSPLVASGMTNLAISHETEMEGGDDMAEAGGERRGFLASGADGMEIGDGGQRKEGEG